MRYMLRKFAILWKESICCFRAEDLNRTNDIIKNKIQDILANHKSYCSRIHIGMAEESNTVNEFDAALRSVIEETEE